MPMTRISLPTDVLHTHGAAIAEAVQQTMVAHFNVKPDDRFQLLQAHDAAQMIISPSYQGIAHQHPWCLIQVTCNKGRDTAIKQQFFQEVSQQVAACSPISISDVIINVLEVDADCWSFGLAQS